MSRTPFLKQIAEIYASLPASENRDVCFIFPNKRSATFFAHFLKQCPSVPERFTTRTISEFAASFSKLSEAPRFDQLFTLYNEYARLSSADSNLDFERFAFWGEMLLGDFSDVDRYLVNPDKLFINVHRFKEISTDYLTDDQMEAVRRYWGDDEATRSHEQFWRHYRPEGTKPAKQEFVRLWATLAPLYHAFMERLRENGMTTSGALYRNAAERLAAITDPSELRSRRYVFIGFNVLNRSERMIFTSLQRLGIADFYWDFNSPAFTEDFNRATRFISANAREFASRYPLPEEPITDMPRIDIIGVPGNNAQIKAAGSILGEMAADGSIADPTNAIDTAVVLPDESMFMPLLRSVPPEITSVNVTMGVGMRSNPVAALLFSLVGLHHNSRKSASGEATFLRDNINAIITNPVIASSFQSETEAITQLITTRRLIRVPANDIATVAPSLSAIFRKIADEDIDAVSYYLTAVTDMILSVTSPDDMLRRHFLDAYREKIELVRHAVKTYGVKMRGNTAIRLVQRAIASDKIHFTGEPLRGLQIMGVLETRALDFDNIVMISMNERTFPRRHYSNSFIPDTLRRGFGMATADFQENIFAYYFYRLISRAKRVTLLYDARTVGTETGEMSRYLSQILYLFKTPAINHRMLSFDIHPADNRVMLAHKTPAVMARLADYTHTGEGSRRLSASALNSYINCPLEFYLRYVEGFNPGDDAEDYFDSSTYGTIVHEVMQNIYNSMLGDAESVTVTREDIAGLLSPTDTTIDRFVTAAGKHCFNGFPENTLTPLQGETAIYGRVFAETARIILREDMKITPFRFIGAECEMVVRYPVNDSLTVNIRQLIDRVDAVGDTVRLVDYKTGSDELSAPSVQDLFTHSPNHSRIKAIMQLMLYCAVYRQHNAYTGAIMPLIYSTTKIGRDKNVKNLSLGKIPILDYADFADEFESCIRSLIEEIFNPDIPFRQSDDPHSCKFCKFWRICGREQS